MIKQVYLVVVSSATLYNVNCWICILYSH